MPEGLACLQGKGGDRAAQLSRRKNEHFAEARDQGMSHHSRAEREERQQIDQNFGVPS